MKNKTHRSSTARIFNSNCPQALKFYEDNEPSDKDIFQAGIVAHAIAQRFGELKVNLDQKNICEAVANDVVKICITEGRSFDGVKEPPIKPDSAFTGKEIALNYFCNAGHIPDSGDFEKGFGMNEAGNPCAYDDAECRWQAILDVIYPETIEEENYSVEAIVVRDYKSAFPTGAEELDKIQIRGQAVLAWIHHPTTQAIVQEVVNLQTWGTHRRIILLDDEGKETLSRWRSEILLTCQAMDLTREARPGAGCLDCWYSSGCENCLSGYKVTTKDAATALATIEAVRKDLIKVLKVKTAVKSFQIEGGFVGFKQMVKKKASENAEKMLVEHFFNNDDEEHSTERALLKSISINSGNVNAFINAFYPDKDDAAREDLQNECLQNNYQSRFGVYKT